MSQHYVTGHGPQPAGRGGATGQVCGVADHRRLLPALLPPLTIVLMMLTAGALLLTAALLAVPPLPAASARVPPAAEVVVPQTNATSTTLAGITRAALPRTPAVVDLARLIYTPGTGGFHQALLGTYLLVVEAGSLTVRLDGAAQLLQAEHAQPVATGDFTLQPGDGLLFPHGTTADVRNGGTGPAVVLAAGIVPSGGGASRFGRVGLASWNVAWSPGAIVQPLAGGWIGPTTSTSATLTMQRLSLPAGASLPLRAPGPVDLAVETGVLTLEVRGGLVWQQHPTGQDQSLAPLHTAALLPGDAALLQDEATVTLRNDGRAPLVAISLAVELDREG